MPPMAPNLPLDVDGRNAASLSLHLLHPFLGQVEVGLKVVACEQQAQHTQGHHRPQTHRVKHGAGDPAQHKDQIRTQTEKHVLVITSLIREVLFKVIFIYLQCYCCLSHGSVGQEVSGNWFHPQHNHHQWGEEADV